MNKKYLALVAGVGAAMAIGAPMAMAVEPPPVPQVPTIPAVPALPSAPEFPIPGAEPNGAECTFDEGGAGASSEISGDSEKNEVKQYPVGGANELNEGNCQSFGNDQHNGEYSNGEYAFPPQVPTQDD